MAARQGTPAAIHDTSAAGSPHAEPLLERLDTLVGAETATFTETLDGSERATAALCLTQAATVAHQALEKDVRGPRDPSAAGSLLVNVEPAGCSSTETDGEEVTYVAWRKGRSIASQPQQQPLRTHYTRQDQTQATRDLATRTSHVRRKCPGSTRLWWFMWRKDWAIAVPETGAALVDHFRTCSTAKLAAAQRPRGDTTPVSTRERGPSCHDTAGTR